MGYVTTAILAASLVASAGARAQGSPGRVHVRSARVESVGGAPRLLLNDRVTQPFAFFYNTDVGHDRADEYLRTQVTMSAAAGVHVYSLPLRCPREADGVTPNCAWAESLLERFIRVDEQALFLLRVYPGPDPSWREWKGIDEGEFEWYLDGTHSTTNLSMAADIAGEPADRDLADIVRHFEHSPYADRIILYHPGCLAHENFPACYREKGPDVSPASTRHFREWLRGLYVTDDALRSAWGRNDVSLDTAEVPRCAPGRFPMHTSSGAPIETFYSLPEERDWVDFSAYTSDLVSDRLLSLARAARTASEGRKLVGLFYGYTFELCGSLGGHFRLSRLLSSPDVDVLASPYSYADRQPGGAGNFMSPADSIAAHGKLWMNEDDTRTSLADMSVVGGWALFDETVTDLPRTIGVLDRNVASAMVHRAGAWWMDLTASNAFGSESLWAMLRRRLDGQLANGIAEGPMRPDVALIVDEQSKHWVRSDWDANYWTLIQLRDQCAKTGASVGYYLLDDFVSGLVPVCKAYVFANAFALSESRVTRLQERLRREGSTAIWIYAPGLLGDGGADASATARLVGMDIVREDGAQGSEGVGALVGERWGVPLVVHPRLVVSGGPAEVLGRYVSDGHVSTARTSEPGYTSVFVGDLSTSVALLRALVRDAGAHLYTQHEEVVLADGHTVVVHSGPGGDVRITPVPGTMLRALDADDVSFAESSVLPFAPGQTRWFVRE